MKQLAKAQCKNGHSNHFVTKNNISILTVSRTTSEHQHEQSQTGGKFDHPFQIQHSKNHLQITKLITGNIHCKGNIHSVTNNNIPG